MEIAVENLWAVGLVIINSLLINYFYGWRTKKKTYQGKPEPAPDALVFEEPFFLPVREMRQAG